MVLLADRIGICDGNWHRWSHRLCDLSKRTAHFKHSFNLVQALIVLLTSLCRVEFRGGLCRLPNGYIPSLQARAVPRPLSLTTAPAHHFPFAEKDLQPFSSLHRFPHPGSPRCHAQPQPWLTTEELCVQLAISRSTLFAIKRSGLLKPGRHLVPKNHGCRRSHLLWHLHRCELALGRQP
jgi:hypothetical protein